MLLKQVATTPESEQEEHKLTPREVLDRIVFWMFIAPFGVILVTTSIYNEWLYRKWHPCENTSDPYGCEQAKAQREMEQYRDELYALAAADPKLREYLPDCIPNVVDIRDDLRDVCDPSLNVYTRVIAFTEFDGSGIGPCTQNWTEIQWMTDSAVRVKVDTLHELIHVWFDESGKDAAPCDSNACDEFITYARLYDALLTSVAYQEWLADPYQSVQQMETVKTQYSLEAYVTQIDFEKRSELGVYLDPIITSPDVDVLVQGILADDSIPYLIYKKDDGSTDTGAP